MSRYRCKARNKALLHVLSAVVKDRLYLHSSLFGTVRNVQTCPDCGGTGKVVKDKCPDCHGTGYIARKKKLQVSIPAGIDNGQMVRIRDKGEPGINGGPRGDLLVEVIVSDHPIFQRQGIHIYTQRLL